jgi:hypothetical protein
MLQPNPYQTIRFNRRDSILLQYCHGFRDNRPRCGNSGQHSWRVADFAFESTYGDGGASNTLIHLHSCQDGNNIWKNLGDGLETKMRFLKLPII